MPSSLWNSVNDLPAVNSVPDVTKILSASTYQQGSSNVFVSTNTGQQLFGGLVATEDITEDAEEVPRPRKRSKATRNDNSKNNEDSQEMPKRQRGRPKVSGRDESAAERRRTQIRLAQRAYRNRKETTISDLTQKVEALQTTLRTVNTGFARLHETLLSIGMFHSTSSVAQQVAELMQQLSEAIETSPSDADKTSDGEDSEAHIRGHDHDRASYEVTSRNTVPMALQGQTYPVSTQSVVGYLGNMQGNDTDYGMLGLDGQSLTDVQSHPVLPTSYLSSFASRIEAPQPPNERQALMSIDRFPNKHAYTYSFQETTFARRLHRLCIERAFQKLANPHVDPEWLLKTFRFTFNFSTKERIAETFKSILARGTDEPLENTRTPFVRVGGAGLHFPMRDIDGRPIYPQNAVDPGDIARVWRLPKTETTPTENTMEAITESVGFGGDWYDCHDVEEYLKTKGIFVHAQASFVVVDSGSLGLDTFMRSDTVGTLTSGSSPQSPESTRVPQVQGSPVVSKDAFNLGLLTAEEMDAMNSLTNDWLDQQQTYNANEFDFEFAQPTHQVPAKERRLLTIEVEKFLDWLADESVCLGRAPGFRKGHVDSALVLALQEVF